MIRKLRIYLDTSVPNAYIDDRNSMRQQLTKVFWNRLDQYKVFTSELVIEEIEAISDEIKRNQILDLIKDFEKLNSKGEEIELLTEEYVKSGVIEMSYFSEFYKIEVREEIAKEFTNSRGEVDDMLAGLHEIRVRKAEKKYNLKDLEKAKLKENVMLPSPH